MAILAATAFSACSKDDDLFMVEDISFAKLASYLDRPAADVEKEFSGKGYEIVKEGSYLSAMSSQAGFFFYALNGIVRHAEYGELVSTTEKDIEKYKKKALAVIQDEEEFTKGKTIADVIDCSLHVDGTSVSEYGHNDKSKFTSQARQLIPQATSAFRVDGYFPYGDMSTSYSVVCPNTVREADDFDDAVFYMRISNRY